MGDPVRGLAPLEYAKIFFGKYIRSSSTIYRRITFSAEEGRLPYAEGRRPSVEQANLLTLGSMILAPNVANGEILPEGLEIITNTPKLVSGGYDPITDVLAHVL